ncbi:MAG: 30S ribosomal protein S6 [Candidatus Wildermuthbacteria bacterium]|nr:30S ribosomal protein S6 [Candidatus Wildermuthbacteria bacterium]
MRNYELTLIFKPDLGPEQLTLAVENVVSLLQGKGGILLSQDSKGRKALLAPIKSHKEGIVMVLKFTMDASHMQDLEKYLKENMQVLRFLCLISVSRKSKDKTPHLVPSLGSTIQAPREQEESEAKPMDLGEIDKKLEEIFKDANI